MLKVGERAPEIDKLATDGTRFVLSAQRGLCTVVYFFPKAFTPGCTVETRHFRDNHVELSLAGASLVGISTDDHKTQCRFAASMRTPFPMIADSDLTVCRAYGVLWPLLPIARRITYVIGPDMHVAAVFHHELRIKEHRNDVLAFVNERYLASRAGAAAAGEPPRAAPQPSPAEAATAAPSPPRDSGPPLTSQAPADPGRDS